MEHADRQLIRVLTNVLDTSIAVMWANRNQLLEPLTAFERAVNDLRAALPDTANGTSTDSAPRESQSAQPEKPVWPPDNGWHFQLGRFAFRGHVCEVRGKPLKLLQEFVKSKGVALAHEDFVNRLWDDPDTGYETVRSTVKTLRKALRQLVQALNLKDIDDPLPSVDARAWRLNLPLK